MNPEDFILEGILLSIILMTSVYFTGLCMDRIYGIHKTSINTLSKKVKLKKILNNLPPTATSEPEPKRKLFTTLLKKGCIECGCKHFEEGPSGGLSTNYRCTKCHKEYNITPYLGIAEEI